ncbi:unnamed protein product, partial [Tenebrio molitor]
MLTLFLFISVFSPEVFTLPCKGQFKIVFTDPVLSIYTKMNGSYTKKNKCCVPGCEDKTSKRHRFPRDPDMFKLWVENIRAPRLQELTPNQVYRTCYVCNIHFGEECLVPGTLRGLRKDAVPTLNLCVLSEDVEEYVQTEEDVGQQELLSLPSTSKLSADKVHEEHILQSTAKIAEESVQTDTAGTSKCPDSPSHDDSLLPSEMCRVMEHLRSVVESTSESSRGVRKRKSILKQVDVTRQAQLTPKCKQLYKMVGNWGQKTATLQHKMKSLKERLRDAEKV